MPEKKNTNRFGSPEELIEAVSEWRITMPDNYRGREGDKYFIEQNRGRLIEAMQGERSAWESALVEGINVMSEFELDSYHVHFMINLWDKPVVNCVVAEKEWVEMNDRKFAKIFMPEERGPDGTYGIEGIYRRLNIGPMEDFSFSSGGFNPENVKDSLGRGLDSNVIELVRLLNGLGFETEGSCGGHILRKHKPYVHFPSEKMEKIFALIREWQKHTSVRYTVEPLGRHRESLIVGAEADTKVARAQNDFDSLTDFLISQCGESYKPKLSVAEQAERVRRKVMGILRKIR